MDSETQAKFTLLEQANGELTVQLSSTKKDCEELRRKYAAEAEESKNLKMTLALRDEYEREAGTKDWQIEALQEQNRVLEATNTSLLATLDDTRKQLTEYFFECKTHRKELKELEKTCAKLEQQLDEKNSQLKYGEPEFLHISEVHKAEMAILKKEMEGLKVQKEDIENHSKNSEKTYQEKMDALQREIKRLHVSHSSSSTTEDSIPESKEKTIKISELTKKLKNALEAIDELEEENSLLREKLDVCTELKAKLEGEVEYQQKLFKEEHLSHAEDCEKYESHIGNLNEEMTKLEELHEKCQKELKDVKERIVKMSIAFGNDKASFCNDMERTEEKWNAEVVKLKEANDRLEKIVNDSSKQAEQDAKSQQLIDELKREVQDLKMKLTDSKATHETTLCEWDQECSGLETEIYNLMGKRKTENKRMQTLQRKHNWLIASIRCLSAQRRSEIDQLQLEIKAQKESCKLMKKEKDGWMTELKKEVNAWKAEMHIRESLRQRCEGLVKRNEELEVRIATVNQKWRKECAEYRQNVKQIQQVLKEKEAEAELMVEHISTADSYVAKVEAECRQKESEASLYKESYEATLKEKRKLEHSLKSLAKKTKLELETAEMIHDEDLKKLESAQEHGRMWHSQNKDLVIRQLKYEDRIKGLEAQAAKLREDMGVEELEDESPQDSSSCSSSSSDSDVNAYSTHSESDFEIDDMPVLNDEKAEDAPKKEDWEMV